MLQRRGEIDVAEAGEVSRGAAQSGPHGGALPLVRSPYQPRPWPVIARQVGTDGGGGRVRAAVVDQYELAARGQALDELDQPGKTFPYAVLLVEERYHQRERHHPGSRTAARGHLAGGGHGRILASRARWPPPHAGRGRPGSGTPALPSPVASTGVGPDGAVEAEHLRRRSFDQGVGGGVGAGPGRLRGPGDAVPRHDDNVTVPTGKQGLTPLAARPRRAKPPVRQ